jgi:adenylate kinase
MDGFPRTLNEACVLESALKFYNRTEIIIINLDTPEEVVRQRMIHRARTDDTSESIEARLAWYREEILPVLAYYRKRTNTRVIDCKGVYTIEETHTDIFRKLGLVS